MAFWCINVGNKELSFLYKTFCICMLLNYWSPIWDHVEFASLDFRNIFSLLLTIHYCLCFSTATYYQFPSWWNSQDTTVHHVLLPLPLPLLPTVCVQTQRVTPDHPTHPEPPEKCSSEWRWGELWKPQCQKIMISLYSVMLCSCSIELYECHVVRANVLVHLTF